MIERFEILAGIGAAAIILVAIAGTFSLPWSLADLGVLFFAGAAIVLSVRLFSGMRRRYHWC